MCVNCFVSVGGVCTLDNEMGVASSIPYASVEEALAAGVSQADIDAYLAAHKQESVPKLQVAPVPLSSRAEKVSHPAVSYLPLFLEAAGNMFVPESNPDGFIVLAVAENKLAWPNMADIFAEASSTFPPELAGQFRGNTSRKNAQRMLCG